jgi:hypothetical protein
MKDKENVRNECNVVEVDQPSKRPKLSVAVPAIGLENVADSPVVDEMPAVHEGFVIECQDGEHIVVSPIEGEILKQKCVFFRNAFRHGTKESVTKMLSKPDWTKDTTDSIVDLITQGRCEVPLDYRLLRAAALQLLIPLRVNHPLHGGDISNDEETVQSLFQGWNGRNTEFLFETPLLPPTDPSRWMELLRSGIVIIRDEKDMMVELGSLESRTISEATTFHVAAPTPLCVAVFHTCLFLSRSTTTKNVPGNAMKREIQIQFKANLGSGLYLKHQLLGKNVSSYDLGVQEIVSFSGTVQELLKSLEVVKDFIIPQKDTKLCFLQVIHPNCWTLGKVIRASQLCVDNPGTLGWKSAFNSFCALKSIRDIHIILSHMLDPSTKAAENGPFHLKDLSLLRDYWEAF